jgi:hypothetical protein
MRPVHDHHPSYRLRRARRRAGTLLAPVHALSRYATADGAADLDSAAVRAWAVPAGRQLHPLLDWSDPQTVYTTYGRLCLPIFVTAVACSPPTSTGTAVSPRPRRWPMAWPAR